MRATNADATRRRAGMHCRAQHRHVPGDKHVRCIRPDCAGQLRETRRQARCARRRAGVSARRAAFQDDADIGCDDPGLRKSTQVAVANDPARVNADRQRRVVNPPSDQRADLDPKRGP